MNAVHKSQGRIVQLLIEHGADVNARSATGPRALALAEDEAITDMLVPPAPGAGPSAGRTER
jgi:predicted Fe-Mo cluster-binding NifX family protein